MIRRTWRQTLALASLVLVAIAAWSVQSASQTPKPAEASRAVNKVRTPYCSKCAEPLTDPASPCTMCGKYNRLGSRFCIYCGNRLR